MNDLTLKFTELMVGKGHPSLADTLNRMILVEHNIDGTHDRSKMNIEVISETAPSPTYPFQRWLDTSVSPAIEKICDRTGTVWQECGVVDPLGYTVPKSKKATDADEAANSAKLGNQLPSWYMPPGAVISFANDIGATTTGEFPSGWLICDGSPVSRTTYSTLFTAIGVTFGTGDGSTTFNLPDLRGWFVRGAYPGSRAIASTQNDAIQNVTGNFGVDHLQSGATFDGPFTKGSTNSYGSEASSGPGIDVKFDLSTATGVRTADETRPKNVALIYCIKF